MIQSIVFMYNKGSTLPAILNAFSLYDHWLCKGYVHFIKILVKLENDSKHVAYL